MKHLLIMCWTLALTAGLTATAGDWTFWRGPQQNGASTETNLPGEWSKDGKNLLWSKDFGTRATPLIHNGRVFTIGRVGTGETLQERVVAMDLVSGEVLWEDRFNVFLTDIVEHRLGWAQLTIDDETGNIYAHGVQGLLTCYNRDGKILWRHSLTETLGRISGYGGRTNSPIIEGEFLIMGSLFSTWGSFGPGRHRVFAMDKKTGVIKWWYETDLPPLDTTYSVPIVKTVNGQRLMMSGFADGTIRALKVFTGEEVWRYRLSKRGINTSVLYHDGIVYASHSEENMDTNVMGALVALDASSSGVIEKPLWRVNGVGIGYASPAFAQGMLMVADNSANLYAFDPKTGDEKWMFNYGDAARGSATFGDGKVYIGEVAGKFHILEVNKDGAKRLHETEFKLDDGSPIEIYSSPSIGFGRVILATKDSMFCIGVDPQKPGYNYVEPKFPEPGPVAVIRATPGEQWIQNGESLQFKALAFDAKGWPAGDVKATWSMKGIDGTIDANGMLKTNKNNKSQAGLVTATFNGMTSTARLRVLPSLPFEENFDDLTVGAPPAGWITSRVKSRVDEFQGAKVLRKLADRPAPPFARMRNYMMPPIDAGYTVQSDMYGASKRRRFWPDMGLINSRYMLRMMGTTKKPVVRLVTWDPMPRLQKDVPFDWKPDAWYTVKLKYSIEDGKGMVRGKVWPRDEAEPDAWTIEMSDPIPNDGGSPGLYAYSTAISDSAPGTEVYFDNVKVYRD